MKVDYPLPPYAPDPARIPRGEYCYDTEHVPANPETGEPEYWMQHFDRRCPYWRRTDQATVCCDYLGVEHADEYADNWLERLASRFGSFVEAMKHIDRSLLHDEIKICGIRVDDDDPPAT